MTYRPSLLVWRVVNLDLHVVELDLDAVEQGVVVRGAGGDLVERVDHLDDAVEDTLWA